jgi:hypothetical protein
MLFGCRTSGAIEIAEKRSDLLDHQENPAVERLCAVLEAK